MPSSVFDCCHANFVHPLQIFAKLIDDHTNLEKEVEPTTEICDRIYHKDALLEEIDVIVRVLRKKWCYLQNVVLNDMTISTSELYQIREVINKSLHLIISCLQSCESDTLKHKYMTSSHVEMKTLLPLILPTAELEKEIYLKLTGPSCNKSKCPVYQYFHTFQDVQFYLLLFDHICGRNEELETHINFIIKDLALLSENAFKQKSNSVFVCDCNKHFWLIIQILCEKSLGEDSFWPLFNKVAENFNDEYILWLLSQVASLQAYDSDGKHIGASSDRIRPNFTLLESALKNIVSKAEFNSSILPTLKSLEPLICDLWLKWSKIETYQILWEYFSKRLNVSVRNNVNMTLTELVELNDTILWTPKDCKHDFELFLAMLSLHLTEYPYHWGKMKGRIYSQLGPNKLKDLNNGGIFNVMLLFLSLTNVNFDELSKKFVVFVDSLPGERRQSQLVWSFYTALVVRHLRDNRDLEGVSSSLVKMLEEASTENKLFHLIKTFVNDFECVMSSSGNLQLHQWLLINSWIHKYMTSCYYQDLVTLLNTLLKTVERINAEGVWCDWEASFRNYVYTALKYSRNNPEMSGTLAAKIAISSPQLLPEAFVFFNSEAVTSKVSANFLCVLLENYPNSFAMTPQQETVALQVWVRFCLLTRDGYENFTRNIIKLEVVPEFVRNVIGGAKDPLCAFIDCVGEDIKRYSNCTVTTKLCEIFFGQAERWITQYFTQPDNEAVVLRIYTCFGLAFYKIGPLLYDKHKSSCPFARLVTALLLPTELMVGKQLNAYIMQSIRKTWHLFFAATVKLNSPNDAFIERILREMVVRYFPHFATLDSPMLKCLDNEVTAEVIFDKISNAFFIKTTKEAESNIFKALKLVNDFVQSTTSVSLLKLVVTKTLYGLFELIMFHNQRNMALTTVKSITSSSLYVNVNGEFEEIIIAVTEKHLAFNTACYFQLLGHLSKFIPNSLKGLTPQIKQHVANIERMRGVGYDKTLRLSMERFEAALLKLS